MAILFVVVMALILPTVMLEVSVNHAEFERTTARNEALAAGGNDKYIASGRSLADTLVKSPQLWLIDDEPTLTDAAIARGIIPDSFHLHPSPRLELDGIPFRHFVICRGCDRGQMFGADGNLDLSQAQDHNHIYVDGLAAQIAGAAAARESLAEISASAVKIYRAFARVNDEDSICISASENGSCNFFKGCNLTTAPLIPCTDDAGRPLSHFPLFSAQNGATAYDINVVNAPDRAEIVISAKGPLGVRIAVIVEEPRL